MNSKIKTFIITTICFLLLVSCGNEQEKDENLETNFNNSYDKLMYCINEGDLEGIVNTLLEEDLTSEVFNQVRLEDNTVFESIMCDVMLHCEEYNDAETIVRLRCKGVITDDAFERYWLLLGFNPQRSVDLEGIDSYLLYELDRFMSKGINDENYLKEIYGLELLDENFQDELEKRLQ